MDFLKNVLRALKRGWMAFAHVLGWVNSRILLTLLYIVVIGPYAVIKRAASLFQRRPSPASYWIPKTREPPTLETMRRLF